jgi:two-component system KDP operon response regulator KdpE
MSAARVLIVEDDQPIALFLKSTLQASGYLVSCCSTVIAAQSAIQAQRPDVLLLDLGLPDADGTVLLKTLRKQSDIPIIVLSARSGESEIVACLDLGADDYLVKPIGAAELLARVRVALRHASTMLQRDQVISVGALTIDLHQHKVLLSDQEVHLTPKEFGLLSLLAQARGAVVTQRKLLSEVWGSEYVDYAHYLRIHMSNLRIKIERQPADPAYILTELGVGYRLANHD